MRGGAQETGTWIHGKGSVAVGTQAASVVRVCSQTAWVRLSALLPCNRVFGHSSYPI